MNYQRVYDAFIVDRLKKQPDDTEYYEVHHILPRSVGGADCPENLIRLRFADHLFAHQLLARIYHKTEHAFRMWGAVLVMCKAATGIKDGGSLIYRNIPKRKLRTMYTDAKKFARESEAGENHQSADQTIYTFRREDGLECKMTRQGMMKEHGLSSYQIEGILHGRTKSTSDGWTMPYANDLSNPEGLEAKLASMKLSGKKHMFMHMLGGHYNMTMRRFHDRTGIDWNSIYEIVFNRKVTRGWMLVK